MANHKSAKKRSVQSKVKNAVNSQYLTKIRTNLNKFYNFLKDNDAEEVQNSLKEVNSIMAKAVKKGILKNSTCLESYPRYQIILKKINFFFIFSLLFLIKIRKECSLSLL